MVAREHLAVKDGVVVCLAAPGHRPPHLGRLVQAEDALGERVRVGPAREYGPGNPSLGYPGDAPARLRAGGGSALGG